MQWLLPIRGSAIYGSIQRKWNTRGSARPISNTCLLLPMSRSGGAVQTLRGSDDGRAVSGCAREQFGSARPDAAVVRPSTRAPVQACPPGGAAAVLATVASERVTRVQLRKEPIRAGRGHPEGGSVEVGGGSCSWETWRGGVVPPQVRRQHAYPACVSARGSRIPLRPDRCAGVARRLTDAAAGGRGPTPLRCARDPAPPPRRRRVCYCGLTSKRATAVPPREWLTSKRATAVRQSIRV
jgi:hypothetical protein